MKTYLLISRTLFGLFGIALDRSGSEMARAANRSGIRIALLLASGVGPSGSPKLIIQGK
jgi:hypothetical protein